MKKILSMALTLAIVLSTVISASAYEVQPISGNVDIPSNYINQPLLIHSKADNKSGHSLNILANSQAQIANNKNVTTWPTVKSDTLQQWKILKVDGTDKYYRIANTLNTTYSLDYYWGSSNYQNCQIYSYPLNSKSFDDYAVTFRNEAGFYTYGIVKVSSDSSTEYALTVTNNVVAGSGYDVRWISAPQSGNIQIWKLERLS